MTDYAQRTRMLIKINRIKHKAYDIALLGLFLSIAIIIGGINA